MRAISAANNARCASRPYRPPDPFRKFQGASMRSIVIGRQFRGPPNSGNGGYVCGVLAKGLDGPVTAMLRAPIPLDVELGFETADGANVMTGEAGAVIGQGGPASQALPEPPPSPSFEAAREAQARC